MTDKAVETKVKPRKPKCMQKKTTYVVEYPQMLEYERLQMENYWLPTEPRAENDTHELRTGLTETEYHGVITVLKLFTLYEVSVGVDYWLNRFMRMFPRPEFHRVASINGMTELNIHAPFYNKVNEILKLNTDEFYESYVHDPVLKARMDFIEKACTDKDDMYSLAVFSMIEGAVLYSSFAFLSHFQNNGKNKLGAINSGISFSVRDENCLKSITYVHTKKGKKLITDITLDDEVLTYNQENQTYEYQKPTNLITSVSDTSYHFESNAYEQIVTPHHRMILQDGEVTAEQATDGMDYLSIYELDTNEISPKQFALAILDDRMTDEYFNEVMEVATPLWAKQVVDFYNAKLDV